MTTLSILYILIIYTMMLKQGVPMRMRKTRVFKSGNSWAVRLPKGFCHDAGPVIIFMRDDDIVIRKIHVSLGEALKSLPDLPGEFMPEGRNDLPPKKRDIKWD